MWARVVEVMLACWLAINPPVFAHATEGAIAWWPDLTAAGFVSVLALVSYWPPLRLAHLASLLVAAWLVVDGYFFGAGSPHGESHVVSGLLLAMFAIVPNHATRPPRGWREFYASATS